MVQSKPSPRVALSRWLTQIHYNSVRNVETSHVGITRSDNQKQLRGLLVAEDLVLMRKRTFYRIMGKKAVPVSIEEVAANYSLEGIQKMYRDATDAWKNEQRRLRHRATT
jgi:hypothetical protein